MLDLMSKRLMLIFGTATVVMGLAPLPAWTADTDTVMATEAECKALESADFSDVQDAPTQITEANWVEASDDLPGRHTAFDLELVEHGNDMLGPQALAHTPTLSVQQYQDAPIAAG